MNKKIAIFLGILIGILSIVVLVFMFKSEENNESETEVLFEEETDKVYEYINLDALYFLIEENTPAFKETLEAWIADEEIEATSVNVLSKIDEEKNESKFYLQLDDEEDTIITVIYSLDSGEYALKKFKGKFDKVAAYGGTSKEQEERDAKVEEELYDDSYVPEGEGEEIGEMVINDPSGYLAEIDEDHFKKELNDYLVSINERRRMYTVDDFYIGEGYFEMKLLFDTPRLDEKNLYATYDAEQDIYTFAIK